MTVGRDLQAQITVTLDVAPPSPITVTVRTNAVGVATLSTNGTVAGGETVTFTNVTSTTAGSFFVQGRSLGTTTLTGQAAGYDDGTGSVAVEPSGFIINSPSVISTNTLAPNTAIQITPARLIPANLNWAQNQAIRGGLSVEVPVTVSNPTVGVITISPVTLGPGATVATTAFNPEGVGTTTISLGTPAGFSQSSSFRQITATVGTPGINVTPVRVGRDLQTQVTITLDAIPPTPVTVTVQSDSIATATLTQSGLLEGTGTITFTNVTGTTVGTFFIQGRSNRAPPRSQCRRSVRLSTSGVTVIDRASLSIARGVSRQRSGPRTRVFRLRRLSGTRLRSIGLPIRISAAGSPSTYPVASSNPSVGQMTITSVPFGPGVSFSNTAFDPLAVGTSTISLTTPAGFSPSSNFAQITATVNQ